MERKNRLGQAHKQKVISVSTVQQDREKQNAVQMQAEVQANRVAIQELTAQVSSLTKSLVKALTPVENTATVQRAPVLPFQNNK